MRMARVDGGRGGRLGGTERVRVRGVVRGGRRRKKKMEKLERKRGKGENEGCMVCGNGGGSGGVCGSE